MEEIKEVKLDPTQKREWDKTRLLLGWTCPAFTYLLYDMLNGDKRKDIAIFVDDEKLCPVAATDGSALMINVKTFFALSLDERVFVLAHEILHCVHNHCIQFRRAMIQGELIYTDGVKLPFDPRLGNISADLIINDCLIVSKIGKFRVSDPAKGIEGWLHDRTIATEKDLWTEVYRRLFKSPPPPPPGKGGSQNQGKGNNPPGKMPEGKRFDNHLPPGTTQNKPPAEAEAERNEQQWKQAVSAASNLAKQQGKLPAALERMFTEIIDPQVDWRAHIEGLFARKVGSGGYDWQRCDEELMMRELYAPARSGHGAECVVIAGDTSGSIDYGQRNDGKRSTGDIFFAELSGILQDVRPRRLVVMWCDAHVHGVDEVEEASDLMAIHKRGVGGGGGTDFRPVFAKIEELGLNPDALVYLTDGDGSFPSKAPAYPCIWGSIDPNVMKYPFGDVVHVPRTVA